jgi:mRNA interferase MazF
VRRGEVYRADLVARSGSEQTGRRPVLVVSHNGFNESPSWRSIIVVPISTPIKQATRGPTVVEIPPEAGGLPKNSMAVCHQVTTLDRARLTRKIGVLPARILEDVKQGLKAAMDLEWTGRTNLGLVHTRVSYANFKLRSKIQLQRHLQNPRVARAGNSSEGPRRHVRARVVQIGMIQHVEELRPIL